MEDYTVLELQRNPNGHTKHKISAKKLEMAKDDHGKLKENKKTKQTN